MHELESYAWDCHQAGVAIELLVGTDDLGVLQCGIRLRPFGKTWPPKIMALGLGETFVEGVDDALRKAAANRWEPLDFAARPWRTRRPTGGALPVPPNAL